MRSLGIVLSGSIRTRCVATFGLGLAVGLLAGCAGARRDAVPATEVSKARETTVARPADPGGVFHVVEDGQTLWRIAKVYGVDVDELSRVNGIDDPTTVEIGRRLLVPGAATVLHVPPYPEPLPGAPAPAPAPAFDTAFFEWPVPGGRVLSGYGARRSTHRHGGIDIAGDAGQAVRAAAPGRVVYSGSTMRGYGKTIIIAHDGELSSLYAHNSSLLVREGAWVERGDVIARVGRSGNASTEHCHFEVRRSGTAVDPLPYFQPATEGSR